MKVLISARFGWYLAGAATGGLIVWLAVPAAESESGAKQSALTAAFVETPRGNPASLSPAGSDPRQLVLHALRSSGDSREAAITAMLRNLPPDRWPELFAALEEGRSADAPASFADVLSRERLVMDMVSRMAAENPAVALTALLNSEAGFKSPSGELPEVNHGRFLALVRAWAAQDIAAATAFLNGIDGNEKASPAMKKAVGKHWNLSMQQLAADYVQRDPAGAAAWIADPRNGLRNTLATWEVISQLATKNPAVARELVMSSPDFPNRAGLAGKVAMEWAATQPKEALAWAKGLPAELRPEAVAKATYALARTDLRAATAQCAALTDSQEQDRALQWVGLSVRERGQFVNVAEAAGVFALIEKAPDGTGRQRAAERVAEAVALTDPATVSEWLARLPPGQTRDSAIAGFAFSAVVDQTAPREGLEWASTMSPSERRMEVLKGRFSCWVRYDSAAAHAWFQSATRLSETDRALMLAGLPK